MCQDIQEVDIELQIGSGASLKCRYIGAVHASYPDPVTGTPRHVTLEEVRVVPEFSGNILSERRILASGCAIYKVGETLTVSTPRDGALVLRTHASSANGLHYVRLTTECVPPAIAPDDHDQLII